MSRSLGGSPADAPRPPSPTAFPKMRMRAHLPGPRVLLLAASAVGTATTAGCRSATAPAERVYTLEVAPARVPCTGSLPQQCLQVRDRADAPYTRFYDTIRGFTYEPGYHYVLRVAERRVAGPPADGSSVSYRLVAVLSRTPAS